MRALLLVAALVATTASPQAQLVPDLGAPTAGDASALSDFLLAADTSTAALRVEQARLGLAHSELRAVSGWRRLRPAANLFGSFSTRGLAFPSVSTQGYDPAYAAIARWPGDTWGLTLSWSMDQLLDRRPVERARAQVAIAEARISLHHVRREQQRARERRQAIAQAERDADERERDALAARRARLAAHQLRIEADYLGQRVEAQQELTRLAEMKYDQGDIDYEGVARQRLALLSARHAQATNAARLATLDAGIDVAQQTPPLLSGP